MKRIVSILAIALLATCTLCPDIVARPKKVTGVGICVWDDHMTGVQAIEFARREAKKDALRNAGVEERVWSIFGSNLSSDSNDPAFFEAYSEQSMVTIDGLLKQYTENVRTEFDPESQTPRKIVEVVAYVDPDEQKGDPTYKMQVSGLKDWYADGEDFDFTIKIHGHDSFLKIFYFNDSEAELIFPNEFALGTVYKKDVTYKIPSTTTFKASKGPDEELANVNLVCVVTKRNFPFTAKPTAKNIMSWLHSLPVDERDFDMKNIIIR